MVWPFTRKRKNTDMVDQPEFDAPAPESVEPPPAPPAPDVTPPAPVVEPPAPPVVEEPELTVGDTSGATAAVVEPAPPVVEVAPPAPEPPPVVDVPTPSPAKIKMLGSVSGKDIAGLKDGMVKLGEAVSSMKAETKLAGSNAAAAVAKVDKALAVIEAKDIAAPSQGVAQAPSLGAMFPDTDTSTVIRLGNSDFGLRFELLADMDGDGNPDWELGLVQIQ